MKNSSSQACPLCTDDRLSAPIYRDEQALISVAQLRSEPWKLAASPLELKQCLCCGFVFNSTFDSDKTLPLYASPDFVVRSLIAGKMSANTELIHQTLLQFVDQRSRVLEIGSGQTDLALALGKTVQEVVTIDPAQQFDLKEILPTLKHVHVRKYFDFDAVKDFAPFDLIVFRHLLEHLPRPLEFLKDVARLIKDKGVVYIEVPDWQDIFVCSRFCDIFNDHFGYYQRASIAKAMSLLGFAEEKCIYPGSGQHLGMIFAKTDGAVRTENEFTRCDGDKRAEFSKGISTLADEFDRSRAVVIWGAGAHGQAILSHLNDGQRSKIKAYCDKDGSKQERYIPNTNACVTYPSKELFAADIDTVVIAAVLYEEEITEELRSQFNYSGKVIKLAHGAHVCCD